MEEEHMHENSLTTNPNSIQTLPLGNHQYSFTPFTNNYGGCNSIIFHGPSSSSYDNTINIDASFTPFTNNYGGCSSIIFHGPSSSYDNTVKIDPNKEDDDETKYPPGYRFLPTDKELVKYYLKGKINKVELPSVPIHEVDLYKEDPRTLSGRYKSSGVENEYYFFTPRTKKYKNGSRPDRTASGGYWRASNTDTLVDAVGFKRTLNFYSGKPPGIKTCWLMHEYTVKDPPKCQTSGENSMRLDDWVLCKVYKKSESKNRQGGAEVQIKEIDGGINAQTMNSVTIQPPSNQIVHFNGYNGNEMLYGNGNSMGSIVVPSDKKCEFLDSLSDQFIGAPVQHITGPLTSSSLGLVHRSMQNKRTGAYAFDNQQQYHSSSSNSTVEPGEDLRYFPFE